VRTLPAHIVPDGMPPPVVLSRQWKKIKKRCSFSSSDRLVRSKSFTEDVSSSDSKEGDLNDKYLTVGSRDIGKFHGLKTKIVQWNSDLKKRRSSDNLAGERMSRSDRKQVIERTTCPADSSPGDSRVRSDSSDMFVVASHSTIAPIKSALVTSTYSSHSLQPRCKSSLHSSPWSSPSPSPPVSEDSISDPDHHHQRLHPSTSRQTLSQDQDSGYDGFCPPDSLYSVASSDTSSVLSSDSPDTSYSRDLSVTGRTPTRARPSAIYERQEDWRRDRSVEPSMYHSTPRARSQGGGTHISQATVVSLLCEGNTQIPPPLPPRPSSRREDTSGGSLPPIPKDKPREKTIQQGAVSLPRKRCGFREQTRRRGSYHDGLKKENVEKNEDVELVIESSEKVMEGSTFCTLPRQRKSQSYSIKNVVFEKGPGRKSLGFTVVGGKDSPKGSIGIYVKSIFPNGQAEGLLREGDEIFSVNGRSVAGLTHSEAIGMFKETKVGTLQVTIGRREARKMLFADKSDV